MLETDTENEKQKKKKKEEEKQKGHSYQTQQFSSVLNFRTEEFQMKFHFLHQNDQ